MRCLTEKTDLATLGARGPLQWPKGVSIQVESGWLLKVRLCFRMSSIFISLSLAVSFAAVFSVDPNLPPYRH
jgi:hypothetical protein